MLLEIAPANPNHIPDGTLRESDKSLSVCCAFGYFVEIEFSMKLSVSMIPEILSSKDLCYLLAFANVTSILTAKSRSFWPKRFMHWSTFRSLLGTNVLIVMLLGSEALWLVTKVTSMPGAQAKMLSFQQLEETVCASLTRRDIQAAIG